MAPSETAVFRSGRDTAMPVRSMQNVIAALVRRAGLTKSDITAHSLRHTFALALLAGIGVFAKGFVQAKRPQLTATVIVK